MPVSIVGVNISKTGNYTILITVSHLRAQFFGTLSYVPNLVRQAESYFKVIVPLRERSALRAVNVDYHCQRQSLF
ncbi:hypothetical protein AV903_09095 [Erwinia tracheiphila]|uniref:Uncharacterized protein n=1 Tax=Erwinia tracheiphila TaxID=65700 RepID=A0A345CRV3_9GAMM|nr:hypothetical protein AV903_09095 [Erwinia tracheiphila]